MTVVTPGKINNTVYFIPIVSYPVFFFRVSNLFQEYVKWDHTDTKGTSH